MFMMSATGLMRWKNQAAFDCSKEFGLINSALALVIDEPNLNYNTETATSTDIVGVNNAAFLTWQCCASSRVIWHSGSRLRF